MKPRQGRNEGHTRCATSPRQALLVELADYRAEHLSEASVVDRLSAFVASREDAFLRSNSEGHVTGSAFVTDKALERVLFVHHVKLNKWLQPGGHCEVGETALEAAAREAFEETGIVPRLRSELGIFDVDIHAIPARGEVVAHLHYDVRYLFVADPGHERTSEESHAVEWLDFVEAESRNPEPSIRRPLEKLAEMRRFGTLFAGEK